MLYLHYENKFIYLSQSSFDLVVEIADAFLDKVNALDALEDFLLQFSLLFKCFKEIFLKCSMQERVSLLEKIDISFLLEDVKFWNAIYQYNINKSYLINDSSSSHSYKVMENLILVHFKVTKDLTQSI